MMMGLCYPEIFVCHVKNVDACLKINITRYVMSLYVIRV